MKFLMNLLHVEPAVSSQIRYFLMLTQFPNDGRLESRIIVEGLFKGYEDPEALLQAFTRAKISDHILQKIKDSISLNSDLTPIGAFDITSEQARALGFVFMSEILKTLEPRQ